MLMICPHGRTHFGRDAEIQAKDGNKPTDLSPSYQLVCHPWSLDFGIPAEMTGLYLSFLIQTENCLTNFEQPYFGAILMGMH